MCIGHALTWLAANPPALFFFFFYTEMFTLDLLHMVIFLVKTNYASINEC